MIIMTGATGHVGGKLTRILADSGHDVRVLVRDLEPRISLSEPSAPSGT